MEIVILNGFAHSPTAGVKINVPASFTVGEFQEPVIFVGNGKIKGKLLLHRLVGIGFSN